MKIKYMSDLHVEFGPMQMPDYADCDVLVLAGDIHVGVDHTFELLAEWSLFFKHIIFVNGNHELYHNDFWDFQEELAKKLKTLEGVYYLQNDSVVIDGVTFIGSTMWSDIEPYAWFNMNDSRVIGDSTNASMYGGAPKLSIDTVKAMHALSINKMLSLAHDATDKVVVVTHHAPSRTSIAEYFRHEIAMNTGYATDVLCKFEHLVDVWIHGHTHYPVDYTEYGIHVVSNQRGYVGYELAPSFDPNKIIEV